VQLQGSRGDIEQGHGLVKGDLLQTIRSDDTSVALVEAGQELRKVLRASDRTERLGL